MAKLKSQLDPLTLLSLLNYELFTSSSEKPSTKDLVLLAKERASPYGKITIKQSERMPVSEFFQKVLMPIVFDLITARELKKPILDEKTISALKKEIPDIEQYLVKDEKEGRYQFKDIDKAPKHIQEINRKIQEIEEARRKILTNPRVFLQPGTLSKMMLDPILASALFDVSGQLIKDIKESKRRQAMDAITKKVAEKVGVDIEGLEFEDISRLLPLLLLNTLEWK